MDDSKKKIAENLKKLRIEHNYSQEFIGDTLGKNDYTSYQRLEHGKAELKFADAVKLAKLYKIPMEWIFEPELRREKSEDELRDSNIFYRKKTAVQMTVILDGSEETLQKQFDLLKGFNTVLASQ